MKTKKWLWITLSVLLALVVLTGVGAAGYRLGLTQNPAFIKQMVELRAQRQNQMQKQNNQAPNANAPQGQAPGQMWDERNPQMQGFDQRGFDPRMQGYDRGFDRGHHESPLFGLFHLIVLGALLWFAYKYAKNSGWKLVRETQPAPVASAEKKDEA